MCIGLYVFVYGTLKPGGCYHPHYCGTHLTEAVPAMVRGQLYDFPQLGYPAMTNGADWVKGYLLKFAQPQAVQAEILAGLDALEGYRADRPSEESEYVRSRLPVFNLSQEFLQEAWGYRMALEAVRSQHGLYLPEGNWP